jgi:hypothetical protein
VTENQNTPARPWWKRKRVLIPALLALFVLIAIISSSGKDKKYETRTIEPSTSAAQPAPPSASATAEAAPPSAPDVTASQKSAVAKAKQYISLIGGFSREGLVTQLMTGDRFSPEDAAYGVDNSGTDWFQQAEIKAKQYQDTIGGFSRDGLIRQMVDGSGFTPEEAAHGADSVGL